MKKYEVYNNHKGDNRREFWLTREQIERLNVLGSIVVGEDQKKNDEELEEEFEEDDE